MTRPLKTGCWSLGARQAIGRMVVIGIVLLTAVVREQAVKGEDNHWSMYGFDAENTFSNVEEDQLRPPLKLAWRKASNTWLDSITVAHEKVLTAGMGKTKANVVTCFDSNHGNALWSFELPGGGRGAMSVSPVIFDGKVIFGGQSDDGLYALDLESGKPAWQIAGMKNGMFSNSPKLSRGSLIINANGGPIAKLDPSSGEMKWKSEVVGRQGTIAISEDLILITRIVPNAQPIIALASETGEVRWTGPINCASCVMVDGDLVFATGWDDGNRNVNRLVALHAENGKIAWETPFNDDLRYARMTLLDGVLFVSGGSQDESFSLCAVDPSTGAILKRREGFSRVGRLLSANGFVYVGMYREGLYAIDPETLQTVWQAPVANCRDCVIANGKLFVSSGRALLCLTNEGELEQSETRGGVKEQ